MIGWLITNCVLIGWHIFKFTLLSARVFLLWQKLWTCKKTKKVLLIVYPFFFFGEFQLVFCADFLYVLFYKNLMIVLHHGENAFLFYFYICINFTLSRSATKKCQYLTWCDACTTLEALWNISHDRNHIDMFERKNNGRKTLAKRVPCKNHFVIANFKIIKG